MLLAIGGWATAVNAGQDGEAVGTIYFDIPEQPLASALDAYSGATGLDILYDSSLTSNGRSTTVKGGYVANEALSILLKGSGLMVRSISAGAITLVPRPGKQRAKGADPHPGLDRHRAYFTMIQASFEAAFCERSGMDLGRVILRFRIGTTGAIEHPEVLGSHEDHRRNRMIAEALQHVTLAEPPPLDMPQPITMLIRPSRDGSAGNCSM
ncbi:STN domain-containing protein [Magnetospirillum fulvum]|nr:STN domain-containing protein [Magnetospirillum fulvum]